ncbi:MAG: HEAT repeat domain-containing protein [Opitutales bacterium]
MRNLIYILACLSVSNFAFAGDIAKFKSGDSLDWYNELYVKSNIPAEASKVEAQLLAELADKAITEDAFRQISTLLKNCATEKSVEAVAKFLESDKFSTPAVNVLLGIGSQKAQKLLIQALPNADDKAKSTIMGALALMDAKAAVPSIVKCLASKNQEVVRVALECLGNIVSKDSLNALMSFKATAQLADTKSFSLVKMAEAAVSTDVATAKKILAEVPADFLAALPVRVKLEGSNAIPYLDAIIVKEGEGFKVAGRLAYDAGRTYANSAILIKAYPNMSEVGKVVALRSFANSGDAKFVDIISSEIKESDSIVALEAMYCSEFISKDSDIAKLITLATSTKPSVKRAATYALSRMSSKAVNVELMKVFKSTKNYDYMDILVRRGDEEARTMLIDTLMTPEGIKHKGVVTVFSNQMTVHDINKIFAKMGDDKVLREESLKLAIKCIAKEKAYTTKKELVDEFLTKKFLTDEEVAFAKNVLKVK